MQTAVVIFIGRWSKKFNVGNEHFAAHPVTPFFAVRPFGWIRENLNPIFNTGSASIFSEKLH
jgi:hypothetical protein